MLSTDLTLDDAEIIRIYGMKLGKEFQGRSFDLLISHTTVVFSRYLVMEWERRQENDSKSLGGLFFLFSDEVRDLDLKTALNNYVTLFGIG
ncbi:MAG: transposase family protein [Paenibacillus sp.]|nr:transposase family protein [Paenibacillus sp.]